MRVTIKDLAQETGYSKTTVSFAFNEPSQISEKARAKILAAADRLGYIPDPVARSLSRKTVGSIGLLLPQSIPFALQNPYMVQLISGIGEVCDENGLSLTMLPPHRGDLLRSARSAAVDGFLTIGLEPEDEVVRAILHRHVPFVIIDGPPHEGLPSVRVDDRAAARMAMEHVLAHGHTSIAILMLEESQLEDDEAYSGIGRERMAGYADALAKNGIALESSEVIVLHEPCSIEGGEDAARTILRSHPSITAAVCMSDVLALGVYRECQRTGHIIPDQLSVVGFDDIVEAELLNPPLTTIHQPAQKKGRVAGKVLVDMIADQKVQEFTELPCSLVTRSSVRHLS
jgi:DNA-binding LacI/PurR family transcriptional regulator